jgi:methionyl-tRNA synthetase
MKTVLVLAPPPTPNGDLHVGHLSGPYLRADVYTRFQKMLGRTAYLLSGIDEHQSYVASKARQIGLGPQETADYFADDIEKTLTAASVEVDLVARPSRITSHSEIVGKVFRTLQNEGGFIEREDLCPFCTKCNIYLFEAYIRGLCPHCNAPSGGNCCEVCGRPNDCRDLREPACNQCGETPRLRSIKRLYLPLARFKKQLRNYHEDISMSSHVRALCEQMMEEGLPEIAITHPSTWGILAPGCSDQRIYAWFEMAPGLLAATEALASSKGLLGGWQGFWKNPDVEIVKFMGFDNSYFYSMLFPAILQGFDPDIQLPRALLSNEFYRLQGEKFSTSRNHAIWGRELLKDNHPDLVRFYLAYSGPETEQSNFTMAEYRQTINAEILNGWLGWLRELGTKISRDHSGAAPAPRSFTDKMQRFEFWLQQLLERADESYDARSFSLQEVSRLLIELVHAARSFGHAEDHWRHVSARRETQETAVSLELLAAKALAILSAPIMPSFAASLWRDLGQTDCLFASGWPQGRLEPVQPGTRITDLSRNYFDAYECDQPLSRSLSTSLQGQGSFH